jgi:hypothetical protein
MSTATHLSETWTVHWDLPRLRLQLRRRPPSDHLEAWIDGHPVTVTSPRPILRHRPEAWATAFALPAARADVALELPEPVDPTWRIGAQRNVATAARWWGGSEVLTVDSPAGRRPTQAPRGDQRGRALCFTGGVDSFYALLGGGHAPTHLLYVHGFDVDLDDTPRRDAISRSLREVADAQHLDLIELATDLRHHPRFDGISWEHSHGAALSAMALLVADIAEVLVIPPSYSEDRMIPWGSHPELDANWAVPGVLAVEHGDISLHRRQRTAVIAEDPLVHAHLRVCWEHRNEQVNCGRCEKCLRTMATLASLGVLDACRTFPGREDLVAGIDGIERLSLGQRPLWADLLEVGLPREVTAAIGRLVDRSAPGA